MMADRLGQTNRFRQGERTVIQNIDLAAEEAYLAREPNRRALVDLGGARTALPSGHLVTVTPLSAGPGRKAPIADRRGTIRANGRARPLTNVNPLNLRFG
jgi:hypothetical protein